MAENDAADVASAIGTWLATVIAIVALVGVVGPYVALQASLSDRNRAMNAVQDFSEKYVTRGYRLTRGMRVFRRIRVPNLSPSYITNEAEKKPLVPPAATQGLWMLRGRNYQPFNTGWAKLAELIGAYEVHEGKSDDAVDLAIPRDGTLEIVNSRTALVVSKHWILLLGLLGRYGKRSDKGVLYKRGIRSESYGERVMMSHIRGIWEYDKVYKRSTRMYVGGDLDAPDEDPDKHVKLTLRRNAYGEWTMDNQPPPTLFGITGMMQPLGRQKGSWSYLSSVSFVPRSEGEIFPPKGQQQKRDVASAETLFWLAQGFLPCGVECDGRRVVISLEDPDGMDSDDESTTGSLDDTSIPDSQEEYGAFGGEALVDKSIFDLQEADDVPLTIGNALRSLGLTEPREPKVLRLLPYEGDIEKLRIPGGDAHVPLSLPQNHRISAKSVITFNGPINERTWVFPRNALEKPVGVFLSLDWDPWGFVVRRDKFFVTLLSGTIWILREQFLRVKKFWGMLGMSDMPMEGFRHDVSTTFSARVHKDRMVLDEALSTYLEGSEVLPLKLSLGALFVLDDEFKKEVTQLLSHIRIPRREEQVPKLLARLKLLEEEYETVKAKAEQEAAENEESDEMAKDLEPHTSSDNGLETDSDGSDGKFEDNLLVDVSPIPPNGERTYLFRKHLDEGTLRAFGIEFDWVEVSLFFPLELPLAPLPL